MVGGGKEQVVVGEMVDQHIVLYGRNYNRCWGNGKGTMNYRSDIKDSSLAVFRLTKSIRLATNYG